MNQQSEKQQQLQQNLFDAAIALLEFEGAQSARLTIPGTEPPIVIVISPEKYLKPMLVG